MVMNEKAATGPANGPTPADPPEHERVYRALRDRVLFGDLRPGQPVTIQGLAAELVVEGEAVDTHQHRERHLGDLGQRVGDLHTQRDARGGLGGRGGAGRVLMQE